MNVVYLSPHLDDAVFSCGGLIWEQVKQGRQVEVWTFATADPGDGPLSPFAQELHSRWKNSVNPMEVRREEDKKALSSLGCSWLHLDYPDCIYQIINDQGDPLIKTASDLFPIDYQPDKLLVYNMYRSLEGHILLPILMKEQKGIAGELPELIVPLAVGNHIDHRNTRLAAEQLGFTLHYYADFPYAAMDPVQVNSCIPEGATPIHFDISDQALKAWQDGISCYSSQISSFWSSQEEMRSAVAEYARQPLACTIWKKPDDKQEKRWPNTMN